MIALMSAYRFISYPGDGGPLCVARINRSGGWNAECSYFRITVESGVQNAHIFRITLDNGMQNNHFSEALWGMVCRMILFSGAL